MWPTQYKQQNILNEVLVWPLFLQGVSKSKIHTLLMIDFSIGKIF
jgi:hypothetical protein